MRKKFTMLLAALFLTLGTAWAQTAVVGLNKVPTTPVTDLANIGTGYYLIKEVSPTVEGKPGGFMKATSESVDAVVTPQGKNNALDAANADATYIWYIEKGDGTHTIATANKKAAWQAPYYNQKNLVAYDKRDNLILATSGTAGGQNITATAGSFVVQDVNKNSLVHYSGNNLGSWVDANPKSVMMFELYLIPNEDLKVSGLVDLTIQYKFNGETVRSATAAQQTIGEEYKVPALDFTRVVSCAIDGAAATDGATIVVPNQNATITVELASAFPFEVSTDYDNAIWYVLQIRGNHNVVMKDDNTVNSNAPLTASDAALWAFVGNPFDGVQVLNKAAGKGFTLSSNVKMEKDVSMSWNIFPNGNGFTLRNGDSGTKCLNDLSSGLGYWDDVNSPADAGSRFTVVSEAEMISLATTALELKNKLDAYAEASYYTYPNEAVAAAKETLNGVAAPTDFLSALNAKSVVENVWGNAQKGKTGPVAGDIIRLKNRAKNEYMTAMDSGDEVHRTSNATDIKALWLLEEGEEGYVKLKNVSTEKYLGTLVQSAKVLMEDEAKAAQFKISNISDMYAVFTSVPGGQYTYAHMDTWYDRVVGWEQGSEASQWVASNVRPLTFVYECDGETLSTSTEIVEYGSVYTISSPYAFTAPDVVTVNGEALEATDGVFSFEVKESATVNVELKEDLPFTKTVLNADGTFPGSTIWYVVKQHSGAGHTRTWKYDETNGVTAEQTNEYTDNHLWCFAGSKDDLKIYNKAAGSSVSLTNADPASMAAENAAVWKMVKSEAETPFEGGGSFCLQNGDKNSYLNMQDGQLKYWGAKDNGSTIKVIPFYHPLTVEYRYICNNRKEPEVLTNLNVNQVVREGTTHTINNPYTNKYVNVTCAVNGNRVEAVDGKWTVNVTEPTSVIVTITEDLPFKPSKDFANANWQYLQVHSGAWEYVRNDGAAPYTNTTDAAQLNDGAQWAFVGDALNGFKILNKAAGDGYTLSYEGEVANATVAYMKQEEKTWTIEKGNGGFVIRQGTNECLNDFNNELKFWKSDASPQGEGSAFRAATLGVTKIEDLCLPGIFTLQAERSPLLYDKNAADNTKLSSGMVNNIAADATDVNQRFMIIESDTEDGFYYLYNIGAAKFVDANLNFTENPAAVLSFEANEGNTLFPWFVKINGKYVVPGAGGVDGNKLYHTATPADDDGKRYRIDKVDEDMSLAQGVAMTIQMSESLVKDASDMSNDKVYVVYTIDRGWWFYNREEPDALWSTGKSQPDKADDPAAKEEEEKANKFAFLTVRGKTYLYSVGAEKFIVKSEEASSSKGEEVRFHYATYSDVPTQAVELLPSNSLYFPVVVKLDVDGPNQLNITNEAKYPIVFWDDQKDPGNQVRIEVQEGTHDFSSVVADIETYQMDVEAVGGLSALITEATEKNGYLNSTSLAEAINAAQAALDKNGATYDELMTAKETLAAALSAAHIVSDPANFNNNCVYTFVSKRGWMGALAAAENSNVISTAKNTVDPAASDANTLFQWAVYTSESGKQYLYNIGKQKFMGVQSTNNASVPFAATPQGQLLTFKKSDWADYPIMFSTDNAGVVNHSKDYGEGLVTWTGGWNVKNDEGSNHKVTIVGKIEAATLSSIAAAVELYETRGVAIQNLDAAIAAAQVKVGGMGEGLGYYSSTDDNAVSTLAAIVEFKNAISDETTVADVESQTAAANALIATFSVNLPEAGKFYRFSYDYGADGVKYVQAVASNASGKANAMVLNENQGVESIFYYGDGKLLSYSAGQYVRETGNTRGLQAVGAEAGVAKFEAGSKVGKLYIYAGDSFHANKDGGICFVDHCGSGHPDQAEDKHNFIVEEVTTLPVTVTSAGWATLLAPVALEIPNGVTAYTAEVADAYVSLKEIEGNVIPANTGVMLQAAEKVYDFTVTTTNEELQSDFVGSLPKTNMKDGVRTYTLQNAKYGIGFYLFNGTKPINGFRAWVELPLSNGVQSLRIRFADTTEIENVETTDNGQQTTVIYDLSGRRIEKIVEKGMYIVNGKKVIF